MESFLTTLPPYVHQYINKYPTKDCFSVLKELICFAVLYSNDRERMNLLSLALLQKGADEAVHHKPYTSSELAPSTVLTSPIQSERYLSVGSISKAIPSPTHSTSHLEHHLELDCSRVIMEEPEVLDIETATSSKPDAGRKSTMPYTFPEWWAHPDNKTTESPPPSNHTNNTPKRLTTTQERNITNWIPIELTEKPKTSRPVSLYNPTIPDLRSYLGKTEHIKKQENESTKPSRQMSASATPAPTLTKQAMHPPPLTKSVSSKTTSTFNKPLDTTVSLSRSSSTRLATSSSTKAYRPGQTATVRARAEQAKQRQLQLEEDKRKQAASTLTSRTSLRLRQQAASGIDWDAIKKDRRKTMPANGVSS